MHAEPASCASSTSNDDYSEDYAGLVKSYVGPFGRTSTDGAASNYRLTNMLHDAG